jgi:hypothetical protein
VNRLVLVPAWMGWARACFRHDRNWTAWIPDASSWRWNEQEINCERNGTVLTHAYRVRFDYLSQRLYTGRKGRQVELSSSVYNGDSRDKGRHYYAADKPRHQEGISRRKQTDDVMILCLDRTAHVTGGDGKILKWYPRKTSPMNVTRRRQGSLLKLRAGTLTIRPQRQSTFLYITYINSVRTSQESQYISVV